MSESSQNQSSQAPSPTNETNSEAPIQKNPWWKSIGPALITACVVFGPGSLVISSKVGATYGYEMLWLLILNGLLMGTFLTMSARIGVVGGATPCQLLAKHANRPIAFITGLTLCLVATAFQFSNNLAVALAAGAFVPEQYVIWIVVGLNVAIAIFLFSAKQVYKAMERMIKVMVGVILVCFLFNLIAAFTKEQPAIASILGGFIPSLPEGVNFELPKIVDGKLAIDPMVLIASLVGTTLSIAGAFFQGNLVRERKWTIADYEGSVGDSIAGVSVIVGVSMIIMMTAATVLLGKPADNIGDLALSLQPLPWAGCLLDLLHRLGRRRDQPVYDQRNHRRNHPRRRRRTKGRHERPATPYFYNHRHDGRYGHCPPSNAIRRKTSQPDDLWPSTHGNRQPTDGRLTTLAGQQQKSYGRTTKWLGRQHPWRHRLRGRPAFGNSRN